MDNMEVTSKIASFVGDCLMTLAEVAPVIGKSVAACRVDLCRGKFPIEPVHLGRSIRFRLSDVRRFIETGAPQLAA